MIKNDKSIEEIHDGIIKFITDFFKDTDKNAVIGISGGKDSTVCAALLAEALGPDRVIGVLLPNGEQKDIADSGEVVRYLGIKSIVINIGSAYQALTKEITEKATDVSKVPLYTTNTPARLRMTTLYGIAAAYNGFVVNTCNLSEDYVGYSTKHGDAAGDFSLLNHLTVTEVRALGDYMKLPSHLVHKTPSDGMCGKSDEDNLGFTYESLDKYIREGLAFKSAEVNEKVEKMHNNPNTRYKLVEMPSALEDILPDAFGRVSKQN